MSENNGRIDSIGAGNGSSILPTDSQRTDTGPTTDYASRNVMLSAERRDTIEIESIEQRFTQVNIPEDLEVVERTTTYFGPELLLQSNDSNFLLTAPGPDCQLLLWSEVVNERGYRQEWGRLAEVRASIAETLQYEICDQCGYPIRTEEHERLSAIGRCPEETNRLKNSR